MLSLGVCWVLASSVVVAVRPLHQLHISPENDFPGRQAEGAVDAPFVELANSVVDAKVEYNAQVESDVSVTDFGALPQKQDVQSALAETIAVSELGEAVPFSGMFSFVEAGEIRPTSLVRAHKDEVSTPHEHHRLRVAALLATTVGGLATLRFHSQVIVARFAVEFMGLLVLGAGLYFAYLQYLVGSIASYPFAYCVAIELLFGFDNAMDLVAWYSNSGMPIDYLVRLILAGGVAQAVPRLTILPSLAHSLSHSAFARRSGAVLLLLTAGRNVYVGMTYQSQPVEGSREALIQEKRKGRWAAFGMPILPFAARIMLAELTDLFANADSFFAKALVTDDDLNISLSSLATLFVPRALALLLLAHQAARPRGSAISDMPMRVMLAVSGLMLFALGAHIIWPTIPDLPNWFKLFMPAGLYGYVLYLAVTILSAHETTEDAKADSEK